MREWLRNLRMSNGLTMKQVADKLGISESYYCCIENGDRQRRMDLVLASGLASALSVSVSEIVGFETQYENKEES